MPTDAALLASLAQATVMARKAARDPANSAVWERAVRMLSTKVRLTPQARCDPKLSVASRRAIIRHRGSDGDDTQR